MLNADNLTPEQLRAIAAAAMDYWETRVRFYASAGQRSDPSVYVGGQLSHTKEVFYETIRQITEAHDAAKKD